MEALSILHRQSERLKTGNYLVVFIILCCLVECHDVRMCLFSSQITCSTGGVSDPGLWWEHGLREESSSVWTGCVCTQHRDCGGLALVRSA